MSLLLEALKKAEKAKEEAQRRAGENAPAAAPEPAPALSLESEQTAAGGKVVTRTQLPDISGPLEILSDDLAPKSGGGEASRAPAPVAPASQRAQPAPKAAPSDTSSQRAAGRKVFEAKFKESNPRLPFYITVGVLAAFAIGTVGYFWYQLRPPAPLVNANPPPTNEKPVAIAQAAPVASATAPSNTPAIPGLPSQASAAPLAPAAPTPAPSAPAPQAAQAQPAAAPAAPVEPALKPKAAPQARAVIAKAPIETAKPRAAVAEVNPQVQAGYAAYSSGDLARAAQEYGEALREEPSNRDALLGMAAVDTRAGRFEAAEAVYLRLLQADPRDPHAQAGLLALRAGRLDPLAAESRVKTLLAAEPGAHVLNFALGNQLAQQERWAEAQQEYFKAFAAEPENADFAYNLAVSLDHMRQPKLALEYYQRAITLAVTHGASFDVAAARGRVAQLSR